MTHGCDERTVSGFRDVIIPLIEEDDEETVAIVCRRNATGVDFGKYGIADYTDECLMSSYRPYEIDKLIRIYHEIPTSDYAKFEQNRKDAARLQGSIISGRDFIHDERPGVNEMLVAMKKYYDSRDSEDVDECKKQIEDLEAKYNFGVLPYALDLNNYEKSIESMGEYYSDAKGGFSGETAIDILNRLVRNTSPNNLEVPKTKYPELNELLAMIKPVINERTGEISVDIRGVGAAVKVMNDLILQNRGKQGIFPSTISAIAFLDKMSAYALRNADSKEIRELVFDPNFKEIVRFSQLTSSMDYNERDFENRYRQIASKISEAYGEDGIDSSVVAEGYRILSRNILNNMWALGKHYVSKETTARFSDAIWSGNLSDELIGLFQRV